MTGASSATNARRRWRDAPSRHRRRSREVGRRDLSGVMELLRNMARKMRTGLTIVGIVIGVLALTVMGAMVEYFNVMLDAGERLSGTNVGVQPATRAADDRL